MVQKYVFAERPLAIKNAKKASAQKIGEALQTVATANKGRLTPKAVVNAARDPKSPLHRHFEWDNTKAAEAFRLEQARAIVRVIRIDDADTAGTTVRAFLSVGEKTGVSYRTLDDVRSSADLKAIVLRQAERDLKAFEDRYRELSDICEVVRTAREKIAARRSNQESRVNA